MQRTSNATVIEERELNVKKTSFFRRSRDKSANLNDLFFFPTGVQESWSIYENETGWR